MTCGCGADVAPGCGCGTADDCCAGISASTPQSVWNRPGLSELAYRVGTHPQFLASMRAGLSSAEHPALSGLRTRDADDLSLALLDGWATVADVLTFYTERIAQEGYLRTATERGSVVELAALVGYAPRPGLSATAYLAYVLATGASVIIPPGTRAQNVPDPGKLPATYETAEPLAARGSTSLLPVRRTRPQVLTAATFGGREGLVVAGPQLGIRRGDDLLVRFPADDAWALLEVTAVTPGPDRTELGIRVRHQVNVGEDDLPVIHQPIADDQEGDQEGTLLAALVGALRRPPSVPPPSARELTRDLSTLLAGGSDGVHRLIGIAIPEVADTLGPALAATTGVDPSPPSVSRLALRCRLFGHQAHLYPHYDDGEVVGFKDPLKSPIPIEDPGEGGGPVILAVVAPVIDPPSYRPSAVLLLDGLQDTIMPDDQVTLVNDGLEPPVVFRTVQEVEQISTSMLGLTGDATQLVLDEAWPPTADDDDETTFDLRSVLCGTTVLARAETLEPAMESIDDEDVGGDLVELDGLHNDLEPGRWLVVSGERTDTDQRVVQQVGSANLSDPGTGVPGAELSMIASVEHRSVLLPAPDDESPPPALPGDPVHTFVRLAEPLAYRYRRPTVVLHGNVVRATHGESKQEVLGSGDARQAFATFPVKQPPLTHLPAPTAAGSASTLEVYVDGVRWREVPDFVGAGPQDRSYVTATDQEGTTRVIFGDGVRGARPPTGSENVLARYRSGQGRSGNVAAGRITIATSRPLGVAEVTNPVPATGGADPEDRDVVRRNAALGVQALDRLVSVSDYADFAAAFAGIGSAVAAELTDGRRRLVHVTIAGIDDEPIGPTSDLMRNLRQALLDLGDPHLDVRVAPRALKLAVISANVAIADDRRWADVEPALRTAVLGRFGPAARMIGQSLASSAVLAAMAAVPGVDYVDLDIFDALDEADLLSADPSAGLQLRSGLAARLAETDPGVPGGIRPAELVLVSPLAPDTLVLAEL